MYYKIKNNIMFRQYENYGLITDNSMFGYRVIGDDSLFPGEEFVSESGSIMLGELTKTPQDIDTIVNKLMTIFFDVEFEELKHDTIEFFDLFVEAGYLNRGESYDECNMLNNNFTTLAENNKILASTVVSSDCSKTIINQNDCLRSLHIEIASECNERCLHCYIPHDEKNKSINPEFFYKMISEGRNMNIINVTLSGGEPLLHSEIISFLKKCRELDLSVNVLTNLTLLNDNIIEEMIKNPLLCVQTSIYSMSPTVHDSITKVKGSLDKTKSNLLKLKSFGIPLQISCPIMKQNKDTFHDVVSFGKNNGIPVAVDYVIFASYNHSNCNLVNRLTLDEIEKAFEKQSTDEYINHLLDKATEKEKLTAQDPICSICRYYICITADGKVFPCIGWQTRELGDLNKHSLKEIWETSTDIINLRKITRQMFPKCVSCNDRGFCNVCMMSNSNENSDGDPLRINNYHCEVAELIHEKVNSYHSHK